MLIRSPYVAGSFYPSDSTELNHFCRQHLQSVDPPVTAKAVILPHAGYVYSGKTACKVLSRVAVPELNLLIGPNHRGYGSEFAVFKNGEWQTPLGSTQIDSGFADSLLAASPHLKADESAHASEHSLEVLLPF